MIGSCSTLFPFEVFFLDVFEVVGTANLGIKESD
jgi:hypothetical protein